MASEHNALSVGETSVTDFVGIVFVELQGFFLGSDRLLVFQPFPLSNCFCSSIRNQSPTARKLFTLRISTDALIFCDICVLENIPDHRTITTEHFYPHSRMMRRFETESSNIHFYGTLASCASDTSAHFRSSPRASVAT